MFIFCVPLDCELLREGTLVNGGPSTGWHLMHFCLCLWHRILTDYESDWVKLHSWSCLCQSICKQGCLIEWSLRLERQKPDILSPFPRTSSARPHWKTNSRWAVCILPRVCLPQHVSGPNSHGNMWVGSVCRCLYRVTVFIPQNTHSARFINYVWLPYKRNGQDDDSSWVIRGFLNVLPKAVSEGPSLSRQPGSLIFNS